jgi:2-polyprenyl-3-methyl-5-hydroxy-6-metoxy-1,4-benzoquinol methylase
VSRPTASREWISAPWAIAHRRIQGRLDEFSADRATLVVLDAGCGSSSAFSLPSRAHRVGIDVSARQLERNLDLHERIVGDVQEHALPAGRFDVVLCWDVLEHLPDPHRALDNLVQALAPAGLLVIGLPNVLSPKGLVTKFTPLRFHTWFYRSFHGAPAAGHDDVGPFPTHLRMAISPARLRRYALGHDLALLHLGTYEGPMQRRARARLRVAGIPWRMLRAGTLAATLGAIDPAATDVVAVMQRSATSAAANAGSEDASVPVRASPGASRP